MGGNNNDGRHILPVCVCVCVWLCRGQLTHFDDVPVREQASDEGHSVGVLAEAIGLEVQQKDHVGDGQLDQRHLLGGGASKGGLPLHVQADHDPVLRGRPKKHTNKRTSAVR